MPLRERIKHLSHFERNQYYTASCKWKKNVGVQIYPDGIRHIRADKRVNEWRTPGKKHIVRCAVNQRQVVIALAGGELVYFEMDPVSALLCRHVTMGGCTPVRLCGDFNINKCTYILFTVNAMLFLLLTSRSMLCCCSC